MIFFIFTTLFYNNNIETFLNDEGSGANIVMYMAIIATSLFSIFFISYVQTSMKKNRGREFGLLMTLGMTSRDLGRIIVIEDLILSVTSIISGVLLGTLFSRLVHMAINRLMDLKVPYSLSYKSFLLTIGAFLLIFTLVMLWGWIKTRKLDISKLLKEQRKTEYSGDGNLAVVILGALMVISLIVYAVIAINNRDAALNLKLSFSIELLGLAGVYMLTANLFPKLLQFIKKRKSLYNRNMIMLAEVKYSIGKNKKLLFIVCILSSVIIYSFSSSLGLFSIIDNILDKSSSPEIEYIEAFNVNNFNEHEVSKLIYDEKLSLKSKQNIKCIFLNVSGIKLDYQLPIAAISNSSFNKLSAKSVNVPRGSATISGDVMNLPKQNGNSISVQAGDHILKLNTLEPENLSVLSIGTYLQNKFTIILNDKDYSDLESALPKQMWGTIHRLYFDNWKDTEGLFNKLTELSKSRKSISGKNRMEGILNISGKYYQYENMKKLFSIFIFVFMFLALLFYIASVLILFLRQFEALERTRRKYKQLRKIGITKLEFGKGILQETRITFVTPVVFGIILGYSFMLITESMVGGGSLVSEFLKKAVMITGIYIVFQIIACEWSGKRFVNKVVEEN